METLQKDCEDKKEFDDSGCVQDGSLLKPSKEAELLDLSDDVLLYILKYCSPMDLKALGYTCPRLGRLIRDRTLWQRVDARDVPTGRARLRWLLAHALGSNTTELLLTGYAREARGCLGHVDRKRKEIEEEIAMMNKKGEDADSQAPTASTSEPSPEGSANSRADTPVQVIRVDPLSRLQRLYAQQLQRYSGILTWPEDDPSEVDPEDVVLLDGSCSGPQFTLTQCMLRQLRAQCNLTSLALQYCNINCNTTGINHFPPTLKKLSLRGSKCYNLPLDKSFLFNIQDYLPQLEYLDLSECEWLEPASFLPLSKVTKLTHLIMRDCHRMTEFVAYASLATRYGFRKLKHLDARGSPLGDSEVAALGWLPCLEELYLSPSRTPAARPPDHSHCRDEPLPPHAGLQQWEAKEPEYFKIKPQAVEPVEIRANSSIDDIEDHIEQLHNYENNMCLHGLEYNLCMEGIRGGSRNRSEQSDPSKNTPSSEVNDCAKTETNATQPSTSSENSTKNCAQSSNTKNETSNSVQASTCFKIEKCSQPGTSETKSETISSTKNETPTLEETVNPKNEVNQPSTSFNVIEPSISLKRPTTVTEDIPSKKTKLKDNPLNFLNSSKDTKENEDSDDSSDDDVPLKKLCKDNVNEGASTSQNTPKSPKSKGTSYVRFRRNMDPVVVRGDEVEEEDRQMEDRERETERENPENQNREARPRAHVLYVNVGQQLHTVYRLAIHNEPPIFYSFSRNSHLRFRPNIGNVFYTNPTPRLDATLLITDAAVRRFGRASTEDVIIIGPPRLQGDPGARPNRSNLRVLSITGFRNITDRSLEHLATAAPYLRSIDFSETGVTAQGVENFKSLRPDCEVKFSEYVEKDEGA